MKYLINVFIDTHKWSATDGEGDYVGSSEIKNLILEAKNTDEVLKDTIENILGYDYDKEALTVGLNSINEVQLSAIVDKDGIEDKKGGFIAYIAIFIHEVKSIKI